MNSPTLLGDPSTLTATPITSTPSPPISSRKRNRENETPSQRIKREKAAERQRRKRERDRLGISAQAQAQAQAQAAQVAYHVQQQHQVNGHSHAQVHSTHILHSMQSTPEDGSGSGSMSVSGSGSKAGYDPDLTPEEIIRRDRVREAARKRQQKHRALVKERKMRELGVDMGNGNVNEGLPVPPGMGLPGVGAGVVGQGGYSQVPPQDIQQSLLPHPVHLDPNQSQEPPFPQGQSHGGQTFATTLLLSFSCSPLLKQHLLNSLQMTNEELASLEPIIADAWDQWDRQRRQHYEQQGVPLPSPYTSMTGHPPLPPGPPPHQQALIQPPSATSQPSTSTPANSTNPPNQNTNATTTTAPSNTQANEFRARFHRSIEIPMPFQAKAQAATVEAGARANNSIGLGGVGVGGGQGGSNEGIDPSLSVGNGKVDG